MTKAKGEAKTLRFKDNVVKALQNKVLQEYQKSEEEKPTSKIDKMDYDKVTLETIAKLPNKMTTPIGSSYIEEKVQEEADKEMLRQLLKDELF